MNVWTTSYIRYEYRPSEINELLKLDSDFLWNYDKEFLIERERENNIPDGTKMVLIDPNGDVDKAYYAVASTFNTTNIDQRIINLSGFTVNSDGTGGNFKENTLYALLQGKIIATSVASGSGAYVTATDNETGAISFKLKDGTTAWYKHSASGNTNLEIDENFYEDYYLSMYVPYEAGQADVVIIKPKANIGAVDSTGAVKNTGIIRGTVRSSLNSRLTLGDFFEHTIVSLDAVLEDENGNPQAGEHVVTSANKILTTTTVAEISLKNDRGQATFFNTALSDSSISLYHSFNQYLTKHISATSSTNTISGITDLGISGTYQIGNGAVSSSTIQYNTENGYVQSDSGDIKSALLGSDNKSIQITGVVKMNFSDYTQEFPSNTTEEPNIGVQASVRSNIAFRSVELPYSRMFAMNQDNTLFYTKEDSVAKLSFDAVPLLDHEEVGEDTYNQSRLGVNRRFDYVNEIEGMSVYDVSSVKDTEYRNATRIRYTIHLEQKLPDGSGKRYTKVSSMSSYISGITLSDREVTLAPNNSLTTASEYVYERTIDHSLTSDDRMFYADFKCTVNNTVTEYSNYRIVMTVELIGAAATQKKDLIVYTYAKINPEMIPATTEP